MSNMRFILLALVVLSASAFAEVGLPQATSANEVDLERCTKSGVNMRDYCQGYCELQTGMACTTGIYTELDDSSNIDKCECKCGVDQQTYTYENVPCGIDLNPPTGGVDYGEGDFGSSGSFCCLPAFALLGLVGFLAARR